MNSKKNVLRLNTIIVFIFFSVISIHVQAEQTYQKPADFVVESFAPSDAPKSSVLWVTKKLKPSIYEIMGHDLNALRVRYWKQNGKTVWVLNEIGKEHPITVGLEVKDNKIQRLKVLIFRESRGGEVRHPFFTEQFEQIGITSENKLEKNIDGISGATLSVKALKKLARLAIYFHKKVNE
ncbi:MAG: FMN-binding protein [Woeseiaceae bacterium]